MSFLTGASSAQARQPVAAAGLRIQSSVYGRAISIIYGKARISGNLIWYGDFVAIPVTSASGGAGKGMGGGSAGYSITYSYYVESQIGLCEGPVVSLAKIWANSSRYAQGVLSGYALFNGSYTQDPWAYLVSAHPEAALNYRGLAYMACPVSLGANPQLPQYSFEIQSAFAYDLGGGVVDSDPKAIISDILSNENYGVPGWTSALLGTMSQFSNFCVANDLLMSTVLDSQDSAASILTRICALTISEPVWSEGKLKILPHSLDSATANGVTYTPDATPLYDLTDDDYQPSSGGEAPVKLTRVNPSDAYNALSLECVDRENDYNIAAPEWRDQGAVDLYGYRPNPSVMQAHDYAAPSRATTAAQMIGQRGLYVRNSYTFTLPINFCLLEPMDLVTVTDSALGLDRQLVRITDVNEGEDTDGRLEITCEDALAGVAAPAAYGAASSGGNVQDFNATPGPVDLVTFVEAPPVLTTSGLELWAAVSGSADDWGGCQVWASLDGATYKQVGNIFGKARQGVLSAALSAGSDPDLTDTLSVNLSQSDGELLSGTQQDADLFVTLCFAGGEFVSYQTATLTGANAYDLTYLRRGLYNTPIASHAAGSPFARLDAAMFQYPYTSDMIGKTLQLKLPSFNVYGAGVESLDDVPVFSYTFQGTALLYPIDPVENLSVNYVAGINTVRWDRVTDFRLIDYEIRKGPTPETAVVIGRTPNPVFSTVGDGTYWFSGHFTTPDGRDVYSSEWETVVIAGSVLVKNVIADYQEAPDWTGTFTPYASKLGDNVVLTGTADWLSIVDFLADPNVSGGVGTSGIYTVPSGHQVDVGRDVSCTVFMSYEVLGRSIYDNFLTIGDLLGAVDLLGALFGPLVSAQPQIRTKPDGGSWSDWQNYAPGQYVARYFDAQIVLTSSDMQIYPVLSSFEFVVDMPDRVDAYTDHALSAGGDTITFSAPFNGGPGGASSPNVQVTVINASAGDEVFLTSQTLSAVAVQVKNGGSGVARNVNIIAQGY